MIFFALMNQRTDLDEEASFLANAMVEHHFIHNKVLSLQDLSVVIPHDQYLQIHSMCEPSPDDPPNLQLLLWLGLYELCPPTKETDRDGTESRELDQVENKKLIRDETEETEDDEEMNHTDVLHEHTSEDGVTESDISSHNPENELDDTDSKSVVIKGSSQPVVLDLSDSSLTEEEADADELETGHETPTENEEMDEDKLVDVEDEVAFEQEQRRLYMGDEGNRQLPKLSRNDVKHVEPVVTEPVHSGDLSISRPVKDWDRKTRSLLHCLPLSETDVNKFSNVFALTEWARWRLYKYWVEDFKDTCFRRQFEEFNNKCQDYHEMDQQQDQHALERVDVIGMTTTGAAKYQHVLHMVKPKIVVIEEAAEVLESHIVSCLTASTQHLILIGDHKQLRPKPNVYELAKRYNLDISLFERLVRNDFPRVTLEIQHRMRPEIAELVHPLIYPVLENHESVCGYQKHQRSEQQHVFH